MFRIWTCLTPSTASSPTQVIIISGLVQWFSNFTALWDYPRVLWRPTWPFRTNTQKRCPFRYRGLECKSRKSRNTWNNRQIWPWSKEWSRAKANSVLPRESIGHSKLARDLLKVFITHGNKGRTQVSLDFLTIFSYTTQYFTVNSMAAAISNIW